MIELLTRLNTHNQFISIYIKVASNRNDSGYLRKFTKSSIAVEKASFKHFIITTFLDPQSSHVFIVNVENN